jgi:hypothetical protein
MRALWKSKSEIDRKSFIVYSGKAADELGLTAEHFKNSPSIVTVCVFVRHLFSWYPFYFDFHSARIIFDVSSGFYLWNINNTKADISIKDFRSISGLGSGYTFYRPPESPFLNLEIWKSQRNYQVMETIISLGYILSAYHKSSDLPYSKKTRVFFN